MNRTTGSNSQTSELRFRVARFAAAAGTAMLLLVLAGVGALSTVSPGHAQIGGATYFGEISQGPQCGGGTIEITLSGDAETVDTVYVDGALFGAFPVNDLTLPALNIPVQADGSYATATDLLTFEGSIDGNSMSGSITVPLLGCTVTFVATAPESAPDADAPAPEPDEPAMSPDEPTDEAIDLPTQDSSSPGTVESVPKTGTGSSSQPGNSAFWLLLASGLGALGLATTVVGVARRRA